MVRMSDLARGVVREPAPRPKEHEKEEQEKKPTPRAAPPAPPPPLPRRASYGTLTAEPERPAPPRPAEPPAPRAPVVAPAAAEDAGGLFAELGRVLGELRALAQGGEAFPWGRLEALVTRLVASLGRSDEVFWLAHNPAAPPGADWIAFHQSRVAVLALRLGANLGHDRARLVVLGLAGCLFDVGLWALPEGALKRLDALTPDEQTAYRSHPRVSAELIRRWGPPDPAIVEAVLEHHEREQGQGFPQGLSGAAVTLDAKILGLADTYMGLTVPPPPRPRLRPHEAVREIVRTKGEAFPPAVVKALVSEISVFPPGTIVRLNTEEIGRVIGVNREHPLRPRVEVLADAQGQRLPAPKILDLSEAPFLYITGPVTEGAR
jgi:hypothetical protein